MRNIAVTAQQQIDQRQQLRQPSRDQEQLTALANVECRNGYTRLEQTEEEDDEREPTPCTGAEGCTCPTSPYCSREEYDLDGILTPPDSQESSQDLDSAEEREEVTQAATDGAAGEGAPDTPEWMKFKYGYRTREERTRDVSAAAAEPTDQGRRTSKRPVASPTQQAVPEPPSPSLELKKRTKAIAANSSEPGQDWGVEEADVDASPEQIGQQLRDLYAHAEPDKVGNVDTLMQDNALDLAKLRLTVIAKYGRYNRTMYSRVESFHTFYTQKPLDKSMHVSYPLRSEELGFLQMDQYDQFTGNRRMIEKDCQTYRDHPESIDWRIEYASHGGTTAAVCAIAITRRSVHLVYIAVHKNFRRRNIGSELVRTVQRQVAPRQKLHVTLQECLEQHSGWYTKLGFVMEGNAGVMQMTWTPDQQTQVDPNTVDEDRRQVLQQQFREHQRQTQRPLTQVQQQQQQQQRHRHQQVSSNSPLVAEDGSDLQPLDLGPAMEVDCDDGQVDEFPIDVWDSEYDGLYDDSSQESVPLIDISESGSQAGATPTANEIRKPLSKAVLTVSYMYMLQMDCVLEEDRVGGVGWTLMERAAARVDIWNALVHHISDRMLGSPTDLNGLITRGDTAMYRILKLHNNPPPDSPDEIINKMISSPKLRKTPQWRRMIDLKSHILKKKGTLDAAEYNEKRRMKAQADQYDGFQ